MTSSMAASMRRGAGFPGTAAVRITTSICSNRLGHLLALTLVERACLFHRRERFAEVDHDLPPLNRG